MEKVVRDGKVAVLYSPDFGAGWYTWNVTSPECLFHPEIVAIVEGTAKVADRTSSIVEAAGRLFGGGFYAGGACDLQICWVPEGTQFEVEEYDGSESLRYRDQDTWLTA